MGRRTAVAVDREHIVTQEPESTVSFDTVLSLGRRTTDMNAPSFLTPSRMGDPKTAMTQYYPRLASLDVQTPETEFVSSDIGTATREILSRMNEFGWETAFVRSPYKAAPQRLEAGSLIRQPTEDHVRNTLESLSVQLRGSPWPIGEQFVLREMLALDFCMHPSHHMDHPEIRFFIEAGDVLGWTPDTCTCDAVCPRRYSHLESVIDDAEPPVEQAEQVADEFSEYHWCADFALTESGNWYCVELNFGGVRWDETSERWRNMCGYGDMVALSPEVIHSPVIHQFSEPR